MKQVEPNWNSRGKIRKLTEIHKQLAAKYKLNHKFDEIQDIRIQNAYAGDVLWTKQ
jgi:hypothetical protein